MIEWITNNWNNLLSAWGGLVAICSSIVKITPSTKDNKVFGFIIDILDLFSVAYPKDKK